MGGLYDAKGTPTRTHARVCPKLPRVDSHQWTQVSVLARLVAGGARTDSSATVDLGMFYMFEHV
jgi:hypothetical protein